MTVRPLTPLALLACFALIAAGCGSSKRADSTKSTPTKPACSASGMHLTWRAPQRVPKPVIATAQQLFDAASRCDYQALGAVALSSPNFKYSYGKESDPVAYWRSVDAKQQTMRRLAQLLTGAFVIKHDAGVTTYAWPAAYQDTPAPTDWGGLEQTGAYSHAEAQRFQDAKSYSGYRVAIEPDGTWSYFLTGD